MGSRKPYASDLSEEQWNLIEGLVPQPKSGGRPCQYERREIVNAILYQARNGGAWRNLPHEFPPYGVVFHYFSTWSKDRTWAEIHDKLRDQCRVKEGKAVGPSAAAIDSQSVKMTDQRGERGYDAGKKVKGRKRHIVVDTLGLILAVVVHTANIQDRDGAKLVFDVIADRYPSLELVWADSAYAGEELQEHVDDIRREDQEIDIEIVKRTDDMKGFVVLPWRWIVERTIGWLNKYRRLSKDYEILPSSSEAWIQIAMISNMTRRLA